MREIEDRLNQISEAVIGAAIEVHRVLGPGFLESTYEKAMCIELQRRDIQHACQSPVRLEYKGELIGEGRLDLLVEGRVVVELKSAEKLAPIHKAQVISYLKATGYELGLIINFNAEVLRDGIQRVVLTR